jgi:ankyrin repeat protein
MLIDEYDADVNERYGWDTPMHRRRTREAISTPIYEAVRNNFPDMVELLLEKGADATVKGHRGMTLVECAWHNKHGGMVELLRDKGVPEGPATKGKHLSMLHWLTPARTPTPTPRRPRASRRTARPIPDSSDDDEYPGDWRNRVYQAILP